MIEIKKFTFNPIMENTYVIHDETLEAAVIDAGCYSDAEKNQLKKYIDDNNLIIKRVLNTHLHFDHQFGNRFLFESFGIKPEAHPADEFMLERVKVNAVIYGFRVKEDAQELGAYLVENQEIKIGNITLTCFHIPGHAPGHLVFHCEKEKNLFSGDVIFKGSIGRTDLEQGDYASLIKGINAKIMILPDDTKVYPGHGPSTTVGYERQFNPYL